MATLLQVAGGKILKLVFFTGLGLFITGSILVSIPSLGETDFFISISRFGDSSLTKRDSLTYYDVPIYVLWKPTTQRKSKVQ